MYVIQTTAEDVQVLRNIDLPSDLQSLLRQSLAPSGTFFSPASHPTLKVYMLNSKPTPGSHESYFVPHAN
jgi:hypothetical protein